MIDNLTIAGLVVLVWMASVAPFILMAYEAKREARHLMSYIITSQQGQHPHTGYAVASHASTDVPIDPSAIELDRATRIYQSAIMRGEIGESDLDELARAGGVTEPVSQ